MGEELVERNLWESRKRRQVERQRVLQAQPVLFGEFEYRGGGDLFRDRGDPEFQLGMDRSRVVAIGESVSLFKEDILSVRYQNDAPEPHPGVLLFAPLVDTFRERGLRETDLG